MLVMNYKLCKINLIKTSLQKKTFYSPNFANNIFDVKEFLYFFHEVKFSLSYKNRKGLL